MATSGWRPPPPSTTFLSRTLHYHAIPLSDGAQHAGLMSAKKNAAMVIIPYLSSRTLLTDAKGKEKHWRRAAVNAIMAALVTGTAALPIGCALAACLS